MVKTCFFNSIFKILGILISLFLVQSLNAQTDSTGSGSVTSTVEFWRSTGYEYRLEGKTDEALAAYLRILEIDKEDWDGNLAVARLYFDKEDYQASLQYYFAILTSDTADVEALWGIGRCYYRLGKFHEATKYFLRADSHLENYIPILTDLANSYIHNNSLSEAIAVYDKIITLDSANSDAIAVTGKLYYWSGKPGKAKKYYLKALALSPDNADWKEQFQRVRNELALTVNYQLHYINENEPISLGSDTLAYNINAAVQKLTVSKRIHDHFILTFSSLLDRSLREYAWEESVEKRWFDNIFIKGMFLAGNHRVSIHAGYSYAENIFSTYGLGWDYSKKLKQFKFGNTLSAGYDYYYYWNKVGHDYVTDHFRIEWKNLIIEGVYRYAVVRDLYVWDIDTITDNPGHLYTISARYSLFKNPKISVGIYHQFRDYKYRSPFYWSPQDRKLNGVNSGIYWKMSEKFYLYCYGNAGRDNYDITHWEASAELGYSMNSFSFSGGVYRFYNPWYESLNAHISLTKRFYAK